MKKTLTFYGIIVMCLSLSYGFVFARPVPAQAPAWIGADGYPAEFTGFFQLQEDVPLRVSIDWGWQRNGSIPVIVSFRDLDIILHIQASDLPVRGTGDTADLEGQLSQLLSGGADGDFGFHIYEHNALRTRMESADSHPVQLQIDRRGRLAVWVGGSQIKTDRLLAVFKELDAVPGAAAAGLVECVLIGPDVMTRRRFVFMPGRGVIYAAPLLQHDLQNLDISALPLPGSYTGEEQDPRLRMRDADEWTIWAVKTALVDPGEKNTGRNRKDHKEK